MDRPDHVVNVEDAPSGPWKQGERLEAHCTPLAKAAGAKNIGCTLYEVPEGKQCFPYHYHTANEEAIFVLEGRGTLRHPGGESPLRTGDYVVLRVGEEGAHAVTAVGGPLKYLCISTMREPEISMMPDSGKYGLFAGAAPGADGITLCSFLPQGSAVDYMDGEPD